MLKMEEQEDVVHIKIIVLVKNVPKKIKNAKMFKELELLEKEIVNGEKEKQIVKKEDVVQLLLKYQKESVKLFLKNVNGKEKQFVKKMGSWMYMENSWKIRKKKILL